jgi:hypothetical protein
MRTCLPTGSSPGKNRFANDALMMATNTDRREVTRSAQLEPHNGNLIERGRRHVSLDVYEFAPAASAEGEACSGTGRSHARKRVNALDELVEELERLVFVMIWKIGRGEREL